jgi:hypothetical protein
MHHGVKGNGNSIIALAGKHCMIRLVSYIDGSWGIAWNEQILGIWEPGEQETCFRIFSEMVKGTSVKPAKSEV